MASIAQNGFCLGMARWAGDLLISSISLNNPKILNR